MAVHRHRWFAALVALLLAAAGVASHAETQPLSLLTLRTAPQEEGSAAAATAAADASCATSHAGVSGSAAAAAALHVVTVVTDAQNANFLRAAGVALARGFSLTPLLAPPGSLGKGVGFGHKLRLVSSFVADVPDGDVVLFVDGYDTLLQARSPDAFLDAYAHAVAAYGAQPGALIVAAERNCYPDAHLDSQYAACPTFPASPYKYLNSGAFAGSAASVRRMLAALGAHAAAQDTDDQRALTALYLSTGGGVSSGDKAGAAGDRLLVLDTGTRLFYCLAFGMHDAVLAPAPATAAAGGAAAGDRSAAAVTKDVAWRNAVTNATPAVLHGNGYSVDFLFGTVYPTLVAAVPPAAAAEAPAPPPLFVMIATPLYGGLAQAAYVRSIIELVTLLRGADIGVEWGYVAHESLIPRARNSLVHTLLRDCPKCTHLLFVDADIGFSAPDVLAMLRSGKDVVGGPYVKKGINWENVATAARAQPDEAPTTLARVMGHYVINFAEGTHTISLDEPVQVEEIGTGLLLIARTVFHRLGAAYPERRYDPETETGAGQPHVSRRGQRTVWAFFDAGIEPVSGRYLSEDYFFCAIWQAIGGTVWLCPWLKTTHTGTFDFPADLREVARRLGRLFPERDAASK